MFTIECDVRRGSRRWQKLYIIDDWKQECHVGLRNAYGLQRRGLSQTLTNDRLLLIYCLFLSIKASVSRLLVHYT
jgi:hypothetical protein